MYETKFMRRVLELAQKGMDSGHGGPFGCVIVKDGEIVGEAHNEVLSSNDPDRARGTAGGPACRARGSRPSISPAASLYQRGALLHVHVEHALGPGRPRLLCPVDG